MASDRMIKLAHRISRAYCVDGKGRFRLKDHDPGDTAGFRSEDKLRAKEALQAGVEALAEMQDVLYAQDHWAVLLIFQAMDAAGKDSAIKHVMSGVNPQGCEVSSFKAPSVMELDHDYLWRTHVRAPQRGHIGIFNRSYYEEVLAVRVHRELLEAQHLPPKLVSKRVWEQRYEDIGSFERYLGRNGVVIRKFFLNVSQEEQKRRFLERLDRPEKNWKFSVADVRERGHWKDYMAAYEDAIRATATPEAPWYVVPADNKWFTRLVVAAVLIETLASLDLHYPQLSDEQLERLAEARRLLLAEK
jgi:PPK2 family polyphosphate:nucleotide phosphotransferase